MKVILSIYLSKPYGVRCQLPPAPLASANLVDQRTDHLPCARIEPSAAMVPDIPDDRFVRHTLVSLDRAAMVCSLRPFTRHDHGAPPHDLRLACGWDMCRMLRRRARPDRVDLHRIGHQGSPSGALPHRPRCPLRRVPVPVRAGSSSADAMCPDQRCQFS